MGRLQLQHPQRHAHETKPDGVKKASCEGRHQKCNGSAAINYSFSPKFKVPGKYGFVCTLHKTVMKMTVKVKK